MGRGSRHDGCKAVEETWGIFITTGILNTNMPRVTRKQTSVFDSKIFMWWGGVVAVVALGFGASYFLGTSDSGAIDINGKIRSADQSASLSPVNPNSAANVPNGGLRPASEDPNSVKAPEAPAPAPTPEVASTTATTTESTASTTEPAPAEEKPADAAAPAQ